MGDNSNIGNRASELVATGKFGQVASHEAAMGAFGSGSPPSFSRAIVKEVIFDPSILDDDRKEEIIHELKVSNLSYLNRLPRNTIIAELVRDGKNVNVVPQFFFPFFPSHMSLPVKAGEHVWVMFENQTPQEKSDDHGFWLCKITEPRDVDDDNYTHADRKFDQSLDPSAKDLAGGATPVPGFNNGAIVKISGNYNQDPETGSVSGDEKAYEKIITETDAGKITDFEPVPRFTKRPGDHVLEGSNNTLISLGTDRTGPAAETVSSPKGKRVKGKPVKDAQGPGVGTIDIVTGRGQKKTKAPEIKNTLGNKETDKSIDKEIPNEGDPDFDSDLSRVYVSMKTDVDTNFNVHIKGFTSVTPGPSTVVKSDHVRIIARQSIRFMVQPKFDSPESDCGAIVINANGDVVFIPSSKGIVKLGGDDANLAILGQPEGATNSAGTVSAPPIISTIGSSVGTEGVNGAFATKVMML
jgi:hypothetical protein